MNIKHPLFLLLAIISICNNTIAQSLDSALVHYNRNAPQENVYVHYDNNNYAPGQTIWYKAYLMNGYQPSQLSKNFYINWYDDDGNLINSSVTPIIYSYATGNFSIPENYNSNHIHAVAYTKWMKNFDSSYFFQQTFRVINNKNIAASNPITNNPTTIQLLPESGNMLSNKLNVIGFKAINSLGLPANVSGFISNTKGDSISSFKTVHDGMGKFQFIPKYGEQYTAIWKDAMSIIHKTPLPVALEEGVNLSIEPGRNNRIFHVQRTKLAPESMKQLTLVGQAHGSILFMAKLNLADKESITSTLPLNKMLSGILQLTVFDANDKPLCERIVFVKNEDYKLNTNITIDTLNTLKRGKNVIEIELNDSSYANYSLAITDANTHTFSDNTIISHLLLNGELTGNIYKPSYYFESNADSISYHLDLVMLTNGWRRYNWNNILSSQDPKIKYPRETEYQTLTGRITDYANRKSKKAESINLIFVAKDSSNNMITLPILEDGSFISKNAMLYDTTKIYFKGNGSNSINNKNLIIENDLLKPDPTVKYNYLSNYDDTLGLTKIQSILREQARLDSINKHNTLKEVNVFSKQKTRIKELDKKYTFGAFSGEAIAAFDMSTLENLSHTIDIFDFLTGKVPGLDVGNAIGGLFTEGVVTYRGGTPSFYLDEMPVQTSQLRDINVNNIAYVKVLTQFTGGLNNSFASTIGETKKDGKIVTVQNATDNHASNTAIAMYTKRGDDITSSINRYNVNGLDYKTYTGYVGHKEFYAPNYAEKLADNTKDLRNTLLWNPWINLDKTNKKIKITFYNTDITNAFSLELEGMDSKGKLVSIHKILKQ